MEYHPFKPLIDKNSEILILGTFPSIKSFENNFYYSHPRNQFFPLLADIFKEKRPETIDEKIDLLKKHKIALWDVVKGANRKNSLDSSLQDIELNDIASLLKKYPNIKLIAFTSKTAEKLFKKLNIDFPTAYLPSPSPAYAKMKYEDKLKEYFSIITSNINKGNL
jgi:TDG/mug DNA glycosylase family protein